MKKILAMTLAALVWTGLIGFTQRAFAGEKIGIVICSDDAETDFNALRFANFSLKKGDKVSIFFLGKGVLGAQKTEKPFDVKGKTEDFMNAGGKVYACKVCLKLHNLEPSKTCPVSTMEDLYRLVTSNTKVLTF